MGAPPADDEYSSAEVPEVQILLEGRPKPKCALPPEVKRGGRTIAVSWVDLFAYLAHSLQFYIFGIVFFPCFYLS